MLSPPSPPFGGCYAGALPRLSFSTPLTPCDTELDFLNRAALRVWFPDALRSDRSSSVAPSLTQPACRSPRPCLPSPVHWRSEVPLIAPFLSANSYPPNGLTHCTMASKLSSSSTDDFSSISSFGGLAGHLARPPFSLESKHCHSTWLPLRLPAAD